MISTTSSNLMNFIHEDHEGHLTHLARNRSIMCVAALVGVVSAVGICPEELHTSKRVQAAGETETECL